jgi:hypothetical protein
LELTLISWRPSLKNTEAVPGAIIAIQTFGDLVNFHPHLHALGSAGVFGATGWFYASRRLDLRHLE